MTKCTSQCAAASIGWITSTRAVIPFFRVENKTHLNHDVDTIYRLADRRQYATMARLIPQEAARGLSKRPPFRWRSEPALSQDDGVAWTD